MPKRRQSSYAARLRIATAAALLACSSSLWASGPDLIVGDLVRFSSDPTGLLNRWGPINDETATAIGTVSCNVGDQVIRWQIDTNRHPVIGQQIYRYKDGRFEQIGISWVKHGFAALTGTLCSGFGNCQSPGTSQLLGVGCSDPYSTGLNGQQSNLGPRGHINAFTGVFPFPSSSVPFPPDPIASDLDRRLRLHNDDLVENLNVNAVYYGEAQYVTQDDAQAGNGVNNVGYRLLNVIDRPQPGVFDFRFASSTVRVLPAIAEWANLDAGVLLTDVQVPLEGAFILGSNVVDLGGGTWSYEYAWYNNNSDRSGRSISIPLPAGGNLTNIGFHDVDHHSGDGEPGVNRASVGPISNADWTVTVTANAIKWSSEDYGTNVHANALRWGTLYNFRFDADLPPGSGDATLELFKPGTPTTVAASSYVPVSPAPPCACIGDLDANSVVDGSDVDAFLSMVAGIVAIHPCADQAAPFGGPLTMADVTIFVNALLIGICPP